MDHRPLLLTNDDLLLDDVLRVAAAAGVELRHVRGAVPRALWQSAPLVLLDAPMVAAAVAARLDRRAGVVVVTVGPPSADLLELCVRLGVERTVQMPGSEEPLIAAIADAVAGDRGEGPCLAVLGACGGAGASVFAVALAIAAARSGGESLLVDADPWGAGCDVLLGIERAPGLPWQDLGTSTGRFPDGALQRALPSAPAGRGRVGVLATGQAQSTDIDELSMDLVLWSGRRSGGVTVVDLPRHPVPAADRVLEQADLVVVVTPADVRGCWAAERVRARIGAFGCPAGVVVRGPSPGGLGAREVAEALGLPLLARMRADPALPRDLDVGLSLVGSRRRPLASAARSVLAEVAPTG